MDKKSSGGGGIGFVGLLTIVFITLKLTRVIAWSWWWVLSPLWISVAVVALIGVMPVIQLYGRRTQTADWSRLSPKPTRCCGIWRSIRKRRRLHSEL